MIIDSLQIKNVKFEYSVNVWNVGKGKKILEPDLFVTISSSEFDKEDMELYGEDVQEFLKVLKGEREDFHTEDIDELCVRVFGIENYGDEVEIYIELPCSDEFYEATLTREEAEKVAKWLENLLNKTQKENA